MSLWACWARSSSTVRGDCRGEKSGRARHRRFRASSRGRCDGRLGRTCPSRPSAASSTTSHPYRCCCRRRHRLRCCCRFHCQLRLRDRGCSLKTSGCGDRYHVCPWTTVHHDGALHEKCMRRRFETRTVATASKLVCACLLACLLACFYVLGPP